MINLFCKLREFLTHYKHKVVGHHVHSDEKTMLDYDAKLFCDGMDKNR